MHYVKQFHINGVDTKQVACIELHGKPNAATEGYVGVLGIDMDSPLHEVYKCVAVNGSIYSWELLSSGMSVISSTITKDGVDRAEFPYDTLRTPAMYVVKVGDLILDREAYVYQIVSIHSTYCEAEYCDVQSFKGAPGKNAYEYAVDGGYAGTEADFIAELSYLSGLKANAQHQLDDKANIGEKISNETVAHVKSVPVTAASYAKVVEIGGMSCKSKNLVRTPYNFTEETGVGITVTVQPDGTVRAVGTATSGKSFGLCVFSLKAGTYFLSGCPSGGGAGSFYLYIHPFNVSGTYSHHDYGEGKLFTLDKDTTMEVCLSFGKGVTVNHTFRPMLNPGSTPLPYEPYFKGLRSAPVTEVESVGVNLINPSLFVGHSANTTLAGDVFTTNFTSGALFFNSGKQNPYKAGSYTFSIEKVSSKLACVLMVYNVHTGENILGGAFMDSGSMSFTANDDFVICLAGYYDATSPIYGTFSYRVQLAKGNVKKYTPYRRNILPIPAAVQQLDGYGWGVNESVYNYVDFEKRQFVKRVECVDMGTLNWEYGNHFGTGVSCFYSTGISDAKFVSAYAIATVLCPLYNPTTPNSIAQTGETGIALFNATGAVVICDTNYTNAATFKSAMSGVMLYYELDTPVIEPISDLLPADNLIPVEAGGTVTFVNEYEYDVPSKVMFYEGSNEVVGADTFVGNLAGTAARAEADAEGKQLASREWVLKQLAALVAQSEAANTP